MNKIKVLFVINAVESGGVEQVIINYVSNLNAEKYDFYLLYERENSLSCLEKLNSIHIKCSRIPEKKKNPIKNIFKTYQFIKKHEINIIHSHINSMNFVPLFAAYLAKVNVRISHSHNALFETGYHKIFRNLCKDITKILSTKKLACGELAGNYLYNEGIFKCKFEILNNAIDINRFVYNSVYKESLRKKFSCDNMVVLGNVGRMSEQKNQVFLIDMFLELKKTINNVKLFIIGNGELYDLIIKKITKYKLSDDIFIIDNTNEIEFYYSFFDILILPSLYEGLPLVTIEAQSTNLPVIASDTITKEIQLNDDVFFLSLDDYNLWIKSILSILENKKDRSIVNNKILNSMYNINNEAKYLDDLYSGLVSKF